MGIKTFKETFCEGFIAQKEANGEIVVGSMYLPELIRITHSYDIIKSEHVYTDSKIYPVYLTLVAAQESGRLKEILHSQDEFSETYPVFIYQNGRITQKMCEAFGCPNLTTDGELMYENTSFRTKKEALNYAKKDTALMLADSFEHFVYSIKKVFKVLGYVYHATSAYFRARVGVI